MKKIATKKRVKSQPISSGASKNSSGKSAEKSKDSSGKSLKNLKVFSGESAENLKGLSGDSAVGCVAKKRGAVTDVSRAVDAVGAGGAGSVSREGGVDVSGGLMNQTELAKALQTTRMSLNTWSKEEGFPAAKNGRYDFAAVKDWILSRGKMQGSGRKAESGNFSELRLRLLEQELRLKELQVAEMERDLIKFEEAREICLSAITPLARRVKDLPASMALKVNPSDPAFSKDALRDWSDTTLELIQNQCKILKETV